MQAFKFAFAFAVVGGIGGLAVWAIKRFLPAIGNRIPSP